MGNDEEAMQKLKDGVAAGKEALKKQRFPTGEQVDDGKQVKKKGRPRGARNKSKLGDRRPRR